MPTSKYGSKTFLILALVFTLTLGIIIFIVQLQTNGIIDTLTLNRAQMSNLNLVNYITELRGTAWRRAELIAGNEGIIRFLKNGDYESLRKELLSFSIGIDFVSICDPFGVILVGSDKDMTGNNISGQSDVSAVLQRGIVSSSVSVIPATGSLAVCASAPVYDGGRFYGIVNCNLDLTKNEYLDIFKERTGCEATIFLHDERISTTITDTSGKRIVGTKADDFIIKSVLKERQNFLGDLKLFGKMYGGCYSPLLIKGDAVGMLFTGVDTQSILQSRRVMNLWIILAAFIGIVASIAFMIISRIIARKYTRLSEKQLNQQMLMADISRVFLSDTDTNTLIKDTLRMVGEFMDISQLLLFMLEDDGFTLTCNNEWIKPDLGLPSRIGSTLPLKGQILSMIKDLKPDSGKDSCLHSDDPNIKKAMAPYRMNFQNYITTPIYIKGEMIGVIDFSKGGASQEWNDSDMSLATLFASTLSGVFLREAMEHRTSIVENSPHLIFYSDTKGNLAYSNPAVTTVTGYTPEELKAGGFGLILDEQTFRDVREVYIPQSKIYNMVNHEVIMICKDGRRRILAVTSFIVKDGMSAAICIDITEMRELESQLADAKIKAEQASRAKSDFLSQMSHEMRTPMNAIIGMTAIAKNAADNDRRDYALNKVEEASTHLLGIINDILDMMKIEANKLELAYAEFNLKKLLQKAVSFVHFRMEEKRHRFSMNVGDNVPTHCTGDDQRLTQIITNLLSNAVKFTPEDGKISLDVSLTGEEDGIYDLRFEVADSGIGISPEQQKKLFRMFEQAESGITRKYGGTGLGLAISQRIVEMMGGRIYVESEPGKGSHFIFNVKLSHDAKASSSQSGPDNEAAGADKGGISGGKSSGSNENEFAGKRLLLAEDIEINREILISLLDGTGLIIDTVENGREAFEKITANSGLYNLVLMDMQMPEMDGLEATRRIRAFEAEQKNNRVPIIAMTANVFKDDIENCIAAGMDDHIGKPIDIKAVLETLRKFL